MVVRHRHPEGFVIENDLREHVAGRAGRQDRDIDLTLHELPLQVVGKVLDQFQTDFRQVAFHRRQQQGDQERADGRRHPQRAGSDQGILVRRRDRFHGIDVLEDGSGTLDHALADLGEAHVPLAALEDPDVQAILEFAKLTAQGRLAGAAAFRRAAEMQFLGDGDEVFEIARVHGELAVGSMTFLSWNSGPGPISRSRRML